MPKKAILSIAYDLSTLQVSLRSANKDVTFRTLNVGDLSEEVKTRLMLQGAVTKIRNSYAGVNNLDEAQNNAIEIMDRLEKGLWTTPSSGTGPVSITVQALARAANISIEAAQAKYDAFTDAERKILRAFPEVRAASAAIRAEREAKSAKPAPKLDFGDFLSAPMSGEVS